MITHFKTALTYAWKNVSTFEADNCSSMLFCIISWSYMFCISLLNESKRHVYSRQTVCVVMED